MNEITVQRKDIDPAKYRGAYASEDHAKTMVDQSCRIFIGDSTKPSIIYVEIQDERFGEIEQGVSSIKYQKTRRTSGMLGTSRIFGYSPRLIVRGFEACRTTNLAAEFPEQNDAICKGADLLGEIYREYNPDMFFEHHEKTKVILNDWKLGSSPFTSGIINKDNKLPYHFDAGNVKNVWSNMITFKRSVRGGNLTCPELDLCFMLKTNSVLMFDGQNILHGVTPFEKTKADGYRYTVVYYSLQQMWQCLPPGEETNQANIRRREREKKRAGIT